jgi:hypothetical protein
MPKIEMTTDDAAGGGSVTLVFTPYSGQIQPHSPMTFGDRIVLARTLLGEGVVSRSVGDGPEIMMRGRGSVTVDTHDEILAYDIRNGEWRYSSSIPPWRALERAAPIARRLSLR